jgi:energy-coupling factor transport system ATP-binding protein
MVEHETEKAVEVNRILIMKDGHIVRGGSPTTILKDVEFLETHGIIPLQVAKFFYEMEDKDPPLTVEEGYRRFIRKGLKISDKKYELIEVAEKERKKKYGKAIIEMKDVEYKYEDEKSVLKEINLSIHQGEFVAIVGQNGSGKTTLVKHFNGLLKPTSGEVKVKGMDTREVSVSKLSKVVGYVFQDPDHQIFADNVYNEVSFGPKNFGLPQEEIKRRVNEALAAVQLEGYQEQDPFSLTKGERQRVAVASILASKPAVLIFDEPTTGLDYPETKKTMKLIKKLNELGHTIIVVTHCMWIVAEYAHRCVVMREGRIILDENTRTLFSKEEDLEKNSLTPPQIVRLSNMFGKVLLSVDELKSCLG